MIKPSPIRRIASEGDECKALIQWAETKRWHGMPLSAFLVMIPNGSVLAGDVRQRAITMNSMKRRGFRPGASDYFLAIPCLAANTYYHGLWLEMKRTKRSETRENQIDFQTLMAGEGYATAICKGFGEAMKAIENYLGGRHGQ